VRLRIRKQRTQTHTGPNLGFPRPTVLVRTEAVDARAWNCGSTASQPLNFPEKQKYVFYQQNLLLKIFLSTKFVVDKHILFIR